MMNTLILSSWLLVSAQPAQEEPTIKVDKLADNVYLYTHNAVRPSTLATFVEISSAGTTTPTITPA